MFIFVTERIKNIKIYIYIYFNMKWVSLGDSIELLKTDANMYWKAFWNSCSQDQRSIVHVSTRFDTEKYYFIDTIDSCSEGEGRIVYVYLILHISEK